MTAYSVPDMSCGHCKAAIEKTLVALDPDVDVEFDMQEREIEVVGSIDSDAILAALKAAGYPSSKVD